MKIERGDIGVGLTLLTATVVLVGGWLWLSRASDDYFALFTEFDVVEGLTTQTPVRLQGFTVGRVQSITPSSTETGSVVFRVEIRVEHEFLEEGALRIPEGTVARLAFPPVVGPPFITLEPPAEGGEPLVSGTDVPGFRTEPFLDQIQVLTGQLSFTVTETLMRTMQLMDSVSGTLGRLDQTLEMTSNAIPEILDNLNTSMTTAEQLMVSVSAQIDTTAPMMRASLDSANALLGDSRRLMADVEGLLGTSAPRAETILASLDSITFVMNHFMRQIAERPTRLLTGVRPPPPMIRP
jgi:ABC-type transporter Mla subunit MlaD